MAVKAVLFGLDGVLTPCPRRHELLRWAAAKWRLGVVTKLPREAAEHLLLESLGFLSVVITADDAAFKAPDPMGHWLAIARLRLTPKDVLCIEATQDGLTAAHAAGAHVAHLEAADHLTPERITEWVENSEVDSAL